MTWPVDIFVLSPCIIAVSLSHAWNSRATASLITKFQKKKKEKSFVLFWLKWLVSFLITTNNDKKNKSQCQWLKKQRKNRILKKEAIKTNCSLFSFNARPHFFICVIRHISSDGSTATMFHPLAREASRLGSPSCKQARLLADNISFLPLTLLDLANQLFSATGRKEKKREKEKRHRGAPLNAE